MQFGDFSEECVDFDSSIEIYVNIGHVATRCVNCWNHPTISHIFSCINVLIFISHVLRRFFCSSIRHVKFSRHYCLNGTNKNHIYFSKKKMSPKLHGPKFQSIEKKSFHHRMNPFPASAMITFFRGRKRIIYLEFLPREIYLEFLPPAYHIRILAKIFNFFYFSAFPYIFRFDLLIINVQKSQIFTPKNNGDRVA